MEQRIIEQVLIDLEDYALILLNAEGKIVAWNSGAERIKGYTENEVKGKHFEIFYTAEDRQSGLPAKVLEDARTEGRTQFEGWCVGKDEDTFWANIIIKAIKDENDKLIGYLHITRDLSERMAAEKTISNYELDLREIAIKSEKLRNIYQVFITEVTDYAITMLDENGLVIDWNPGCEKIKGYSHDEIIGKHLSIFYMPEDRKDMVPESLLLKAAKEGRAEHHGWRMKKDGSRFWAHVIFIAIYDKDGIVRNYVKITKDLTPWVQKEIDLKDRIAYLERELEALKHGHVL